MTARKIVPIARKRGERLSFDPSGPVLVPTKAPFAQPTPPAPVLSIVPDVPAAPTDQPGPVERQARADIDQLGGSAGLRGAESTLAESVYALARGIDATSAGNGSTLAAMAAAAKEMRSTVDRILELVAGRTDDSDPRTRGMDTPD